MTDRYLVTGCAGFIGGHLLRRLIADGVETVGVDDFSTGRRESLDDVWGKFEFVEGTLCDREVAARAVRGVNRILHQASIPSVPRSVANPLESMHSSVTATISLLSAAKAAGVKRVVQAASSSAYGENPNSPLHEALLPEPMSPYAAAKLAQEHYARAFFVCHGLDTVSLRYFNVFGPRQDPAGDYAAVIPKFIAAMLAGERPIIFGDGTQSRDFTYVDNIVEGNLLAARHPEPLRGMVMNLALGDRITLNQLVETINNIIGTGFEPKYAPSRIGDIAHSQADVSLIWKVLGFEGGIDFEEGMRRTVEFFRK